MLMWIFHWAVVDLIIKIKSEIHGQNYREKAEIMVIVWMLKTCDFDSETISV